MTWGLVRGGWWASRAGGSGALCCCCCVRPAPGAAPGHMPGWGAAVQALSGLLAWVNRQASAQRGCGAWAAHSWRRTAPPPLQPAPGPPVTDAPAPIRCDRQGASDALGGGGARAYAPARIQARLLRPLPDQAPRARWPAPAGPSRRHRRRQLAEMAPPPGACLPDRGQLAAGSARASGRTSGRLRLCGSPRDQLAHIHQPRQPARRTTLIAGASSSPQPAPPAVALSAGCSDGGPRPGGDALRARALRHCR